MIEELRLSPLGYVVLLLALGVLAYLLATTESSGGFVELAEEEEPEVPKLSPNYGRVIWLEGRRWN